MIELFLHVCSIRCLRRSKRQHTGVLAVFVHSQVEDWLRWPWLCVPVWHRAHHSADRNVYLLHAVCASKRSFSSKCYHGSTCMTSTWQSSVRNTGTHTHHFEFRYMSTYVCDMLRVTNGTSRRPVIPHQSAANKIYETSFDKINTKFSLSLTFVSTSPRIAQTFGVCLTLYYYNIT